MNTSENRAVGLAFLLSLAIVAGVSLTARVYLLEDVKTVEAGDVQFMTPVNQAR